MLMVFGTSSLVQNIMVQQNPYNARFFIQMIDHLEGRSPLSTQQISDSILTLSSNDIQHFGRVAIGIFPSIFVLFGITIMVRRR